SPTCARATPRRCVRPDRGRPGRPAPQPKPHRRARSRKATAEIAENAEQIFSPRSLRARRLLSRASTSPLPFRGIAFVMYLARGQRLLQLLEPLVGDERVIQVELTKALDCRQVRGAGVGELHTVEPEIDQLRQRGEFRN